MNGTCSSDDVADAVGAVGTDDGVRTVSVGTDSSDVVKGRSVIPRATVDLVVALISSKAIVAILALQQVVAVTTVQAIVSSAAKQRIATGESLDQFIPFATLKRIITLGTQNDLLTCRGRRGLVSELEVAIRVKRF